MAKELELTSCVLSYDELGSGPPLVLLHGGGPGASGLGNFAVVADALASTYRLLIPDMPGFGNSRITKDTGESYLELAATAIAELAAAVSEEPVGILGNSLGGAVATRVCIQSPGLVRKLVLMGPAGYRTELFTPTPMEGVRLLMSYYPDPSLEKMRHLISTFVYNASDPRYEDIARARYESSIDPERAAGYRRAVGPGHPPNRLTLEDLKGVETPTLLIWGRDDRFVGVDDALGFLAALPNARLLIFSHCGHWVQAEVPDGFVNHVRAFLEEAA